MIKNTESESSSEILDSAQTWAAALLIYVAIFLITVYVIPGRFFAWLHGMPW